MNRLQRLILHRIDNYQRRGGGQEAFRVACNFEPGCSEYTRQAVIRFGAWRGLWLAWRRIGRCRQPDLVEKIRDPVPSELRKAWRPREARIGVVKLKLGEWVRRLDASPVRPGRLSAHVNER